MEETKESGTKDAGTITIKKDSLWKYSTFVLLAVVVIVGFFMLRGDGGSGAAVNTGNSGSTGQVDLSPFLQNSQLYPSLGPEDADNVVIEFADFQCPWCAIASGLPSWAIEAAQTSPQVNSVLNSAKIVEDMAKQGNLRFVYVPMSFLGQESIYAAEAGYCAHEQDKFWEMHDIIFAAHDGEENNGKYSKENLKILAHEISGLDQNKFANCLDDGKYSSDVQASANQARTAATGTPTMYINGQKVSPTPTAVQAALQ